MEHLLLEPCRADPREQNSFKEAPGQPTTHGGSFRTLSGCPHSSDLSHSKPASLTVTARPDSFIPSFAGTKHLAFQALNSSGSRGSSLGLWPLLPHGHWEKQATKFDSLVCVTLLSRPCKFSSLSWARGGQPAELPKPVHRFLSSLVQQS